MNAFRRNVTSTEQEPQLTGEAAGLDYYGPTAYARCRTPAQEARLRKSLDAGGADSRWRE